MPRLGVRNLQSARTWMGSMGGRAGKRSSMLSVSPLSVVGVHQLTLTLLGPHKDLSELCQHDHTEVENCIIISVLSLFRWKKSSRTPILQRQPNFRTGSPQMWLTKPQVASQQLCTPGMVSHGACSWQQSADPDAVNGQPQNNASSQLRTVELCAASCFPTSQLWQKNQGWKISL
jgi:hypothetical protein